MHFHLEIIMPPTDDVEAAVKQIMMPFCEIDSDDEDEQDNRSSYRFWDWYVIGGRWSRVKVESMLGKDRIDAFMSKLADMKVTVSSFRAGKQSLQPESQIAMVDALWRDMFPESGLEVCPLFAHFNDQYKNSFSYGDVCRLYELPQELAAEKTIVAIPNYRNDGLEAGFMIQKTFWNGVCHVESIWSGKVSDVIPMHIDKLKSYKDEYREQCTPKPDWLVVTVDCHS